MLKSQLSGCIQQIMNRHIEVTIAIYLRKITLSLIYNVINTRLEIHLKIKTENQRKKI